MYIFKLFLSRPFKLSSVEVFLIGAVAKAVATTVTYPLQTTQSILRVGSCLYLSTMRQMWSGNFLPFWNNMFSFCFSFFFHPQFGQFSESKDKSKLLSSLRTLKCLLVNRVRWMNTVTPRREETSLLYYTCGVVKNKLKNRVISCHVILYSNFPWKNVPSAGGPLLSLYK